MSVKNNKVMTVGGGCFWCVAAIFDEVKGVEKVVSGYMGGNVPGTPTYREVCSGLTGHAEVVQMTFDPSIISYEDMLIIFMTTHDPTTLNRQVADVGTQYRSVIYYHNDEQREMAQTVIKNLASYYEKPIATEVSAAETFHKAEASHQDYYANNQSAGYCTAVIIPKLAKLRKMHADKLKQVNI